MQFSLLDRIERCCGGTASPEGLGSNGGEAVQIAFGVSLAIHGANAGGGAGVPKSIWLSPLAPPDLMMFQERKVRQ